MERAESLIHIFPAELRKVLGQASEQYKSLEEIRLRADRPIILKLRGRETFLDENGRFTDRLSKAYRIDAGMILQVMNRVCRDSVYAYEDEVKLGFLTVPGGHRVGIVGQVVIGESGRVRTMKHIAGMNIRVAHEIKGAADRVLPALYEDGRLCSTLIVSPPGCGKTTMLRDIVRQVSDGSAWGAGMTVGVVDERSEIAGCYLGVPQNDVGIRTDVLDACPKVYGMMMLIRAMAPGVVAIDEMGSREDFDAMRLVHACGCRLLATVHAADREELFKKEYVGEMLREGFFARCVVLDKQNGCPHVAGIYNREGMLCLS